MLPGTFAPLPSRYTNFGPLLATLQPGYDPGHEGANMLWTFGEWVHQHSFLLLLMAVLGGTALVLLVKRRSYWLWSVWFGLALAATGTVFLLRTPAASVSEHLSQPAIKGNETAFLPAYHELVGLGSEEQIGALLAAGPKPTLVEVYVDYGSWLSDADSCREQDRQGMEDRQGVAVERRGVCRLEGKSSVLGADRRRDHAHVYIV